ncbi:LuxR C-terminal-related transcriptional regulator [Parafrankia elaeagni]|uniref:LuxR C-terminal-related transcriptional regulator n=1 Tax=Parafrankia elaeagni TaxID=222534 RepID=UPI0003684879|nr:LuxR C-terminal-related transcriptional regulator [Parafrankia elaeagni]
MRLSELGFDGLDEFSDEVWRTVARHPSCGVDLLAEWLRRPESIVQEELERLVEAGLVRQVGHQWEPQDPARVLQARHAAREAALVAERARMADERAQLYRSGLFGDYVAGRRRAGTSSGVQVLARDEIFPRMAEFTRKSNQSIRFLLNGPQPPGLGGEVTDLLVPAVGRGVRISSAWTESAISAARRRNQGRRLPPIGQIHVAQALPMRAIVWDGAAALVPVRDDDLDEGAFVVVAPTLVLAVADMVTRTQQAAERRGTPAGTVDEPAALRRQRALLRLLAIGFDDSRAARELGVSDRTVKRDVAELCQRFGVLTRFQLGAAAARAGFLVQAPQETEIADLTGTAGTADASGGVGAGGAGRAVDGAGPAAVIRTGGVLAIPGSARLPTRASAVPSPPSPSRPAVSPSPSLSPDVRAATDGRAAPDARPGSGPDVEGGGPGPRGTSAAGRTGEARARVTDLSTVRPIHGRNGMNRTRRPLSVT